MFVIAPTSLAVLKVSIPQIDPLWFCICLFLPFMWTTQVSKKCKANIREDNRNCEYKPALS